MTEAPKISVLDNPHAPEFFSDGALSFHLYDGVVRIVFTSVHTPQSPTGQGQPQHVVIGRMMLTVPAAQELAAGLNDFLERQGLSPAAAIRGSATAQ